MRSRFLQPAFLVLGAVHAVKIVMGEKKLEGCISKSLHIGGVKVHYHAIGDRFGTGSNRGASTF